MLLYFRILWAKIFGLSLVGVYYGNRHKLRHVKRDMDGNLFVKIYDEFIILSPWSERRPLLWFNKSKLDKNVEFVNGMNDMGTILGLEKADLPSAFSAAIGANSDAPKSSPIIIKKLHDL